MLSRQDAKHAKKDCFLVSPNLGAFASLRETWSAASETSVRLP